MAAGVHTLGVISDTHGLVRPQALAALAGVERIVHAGDIGEPAVLEALARVAPVTAVRGNSDRGRWAAGIAETEVLEVGGVSLYVLHDLHELDLDPRAAGFAAVIAGHSHQPRIDEREGVLYLNPGSAGPRRFRLPVSVAVLTVADGRLHAEVRTLIGERMIVHGDRGGARAWDLQTRGATPPLHPRPGARAQFK